MGVVEKCQVMTEDMGLMVWKLVSGKGGGLRGWMWGSLRGLGSAECWHCAGRAAR